VQGKVEHEGNDKILLTNVAHLLKEKEGDMAFAISKRQQYLEKN